MRSCCRVPRDGDHQVDTVYFYREYLDNLNDEFTKIQQGFQQALSKERRENAVISADDDLAIGGVHPWFVNDAEAGAAIISKTDQWESSVFDNLRRTQGSDNSANAEKLAPAAGGEEAGSRTPLLSRMRDALRYRHEDTLALGNQLITGATHELQQGLQAHLALGAVPATIARRTLRTVRRCIFVGLCLA